MIPRLYPDFDPDFHDARRLLPAFAFLAGFLWDAVTLGREVEAMDLWILAGYLGGAAALAWFLGRRAFLASLPATAPAAPTALPWWWESGPYLLLQFFLGGLLSALFIFYFKSASHLLAILWALGLAALLVANEFLVDRYRRFTLTWAMSGLCAMLLLNFVVPHLVGSIAAFWFFLSTFAGAGLVHLIWLKTPGQPGRIRPMWAVAAALMLAYLTNLIPPVPLVARDIAVGHQLLKVDGKYRLRQEAAPWWRFWRRADDTLHPVPGQPLYCVSAVFAPAGLDTRLYHHWLRHDPERGWVSHSRIGFNLAGGRKGGYRGYTWKRNLPPGTWKVVVETENGRTVAHLRFRVERPGESPARLFDVDF